MTRKVLQMPQPIKGMAEQLRDAMARRLAASTLAEKRAVEEEIADILRGKKSADAFDPKLAQTGEQE